MNIVKKTMAWLLAITMLVTSVDYVHAAEAVHESQEIVTAEVSQGDSSAVGVSEGNVTDGDVTGGDATDGDVTEGDVTDGDVVLDDVSGNVYASIEAVSTEGILYSGEENGVTWSITESGLLTIGGRYNSDASTAMKRDWLKYKTDIKKVVVTAENVRNMYRWFYSCPNVTEIDLSHFDTSNVTDMSDLFYDCSSLSSLDLGDFDTSNITDMSWMFYNCSSLTSLDLSSFDTSNVTDMSYMFYRCQSLTGLDLSGFDTSNVTKMARMFCECQSMTSLDMSGFNTGNVTDMSDMFSGCSSLSSLDLSSLDMSNVTNMFRMFSGCSSLSSLDMSGLDTSNVTNMSRMFYTCSSLSSLDLSGLDTGNVTNMSNMFYNCKSLSSLDVSSFDTSKVTNMSCMFQLGSSSSSSSLTDLDLSGFDTSNVTDMSNMFLGCGSLSSLDLSGFNTGNVTDMSNMFYNCSGLSSLDLSGFDTGNVTDMCWMFHNCSGLSSLDLSDFDTGNVTDMRAMFYNCSSLGSLDLGSFDTGNVTDMSQMFYYCSSLGSLDLSGLDASNVTDMSWMFCNCSSLSSLDLSGFDTGNVTNMYYMFKGCSSLASLDLSSFDTSNVTNVSNMLTGCTALVELKCLPNLQMDVSIPKIMQDASGNVYSAYLPKNLTEGIWLYAQSKQQGESSGLKWSLLEDGTLIISGEYDGTDALGTELPWHAYATDITRAIVTAKGVESTAYWFAGCSNLMSVNLNGFDSSKVTNMEAMFKNCVDLDEIDVSCLDMSKVTNAKDMFFGCSGLEVAYAFKNLNITIELPHHMVEQRNGQYIEYTGFPRNIKNKLKLETGYYHGTLDGLRWYIFDDADTLYITGENTNTELPEEAVTYQWKSYTRFYSKVVTDAKGVLSIAHWFEDCTNITEVDVSKFDTSSLVDATDMFKDCTGLEKVKTFRNLSVPVALPFTMFDDKAGAYAECPLKRTEDLWIYKREPAGEIHGIGWMLLEDGTLVIGGTDTSTTVSDSITWPWHAYSDDIKKVKVYAKNVKNTAYWFAGCNNLTEADLSGFDMANVISATNMMNGCGNLLNINTSKNLAVDVALPAIYGNEIGVVYESLPKNMSDSILLQKVEIIYSGTYCGMNWTINALGGLTLSGTFTKSAATDTTWLDYPAQITSAKVTATGVTSTIKWFYELPNLKNVDLSEFDSSNVTDMNRMFYNCTSLKELKLGNFDTSKVTNMDRMFSLCSSLETLDVSKFNTANVTNMNSMFHGCSSLTNLDVSGFDTSKVTDMENMFSKSSSLTALDVSGFDTSKVTMMDWMFYNCSKLTALDVSGFDTSNVTHMGYMFGGCSNLTELNVSGFNTSKVTNMKGMFGDCAKLTSLDVSRFEMQNATNADDMFMRCSGLEEIHMPASLSINIMMPKDMYNYLGELQTGYFPKHIPEAEVYYAVSPVKEGEIHVSKVYPQIYTGKAIKPEIRIYDGANRLLDKKDFTITYKNNTKAASQDAVNAKGKSIAPTIIVKGKGNYTKQETITFDILAKNLADEDVAVSELVAVAGKKVQTPVPKLTYNGKKLVNKKDFTVSYPDMSEENPDAYKAPGTYRVVVTGIGNFTGTREIAFTITGGTLMSKVKIAKIPGQTYTGAAIEPEIKVTHGKKVLVKGTDYTVSYAKNVEIGKATVIVTGMGDYAGSKTATFQITGQSIAKAKVEGITAKTYNGKAQTQDITVTLKGQEKPLVAETDYEVAYSKNTNAGTATMTITGKGSYTGKIKKTFKINAYDLSVDESKLFAGEPENLIVAYEKGGSNPSLSLTFDGAELAEKKDYTLSYANNKKVAGADAAKAPTITVKGKGNFKGSIKIPFSIVAKNLQDAKNPVKISVPDVAYSKTKGKYISKPVLTDVNSKKLVAGTDYEKAVVYTLADGTVLDKKSVVEAGQTVTVTVTGKGNYSGTISATYSITQASFKSAKIKIAPQVYTGKEITLSGEDFTSVKIGKDTLVYGEDFEIVEGSYKNNVKKGTASVTIKGKDNYGGEKTVKFKIVPKELIWFWRLFE